MTVLDPEFKEFLSRIAPSRQMRETILHTRDALRSQICYMFETTLTLPRPVFFDQGSLATDTLIQPLSGHFEIEDGLDLQHLGMDPSKWPNPEIAHLVILKAVSDCGANIAIDRKHCVCVSCTQQCRIHLFIYAPNGKNAMMAGNGADGWHRSPFRLLPHWFERKRKAMGDQLRRVVCYLQAWADYQNLPCRQLTAGRLLTILTAKHFQRHDGRDDLALALTVAKMAAAAATPPQMELPCIEGLPVPDELTPREKERFLQSLVELSKDAAKAVASQNRAVAFGLWRRQLGDHFSMDFSGNSL